MTDGVLTLKGNPFNGRNVPKTGFRRWRDATVLRFHKELNKKAQRMFSYFLLGPLKLFIVMGNDFDDDQYSWIVLVFKLVGYVQVLDWVNLLAQYRHETFSL